MMPPKMTAGAVPLSVDTALLEADADRLDDAAEDEAEATAVAALFGKIRGRKANRNARHTRNFRTRQR